MAAGFPAVQVKSERPLPNKKHSPDKHKQPLQQQNCLSFTLRSVVYFKNVEDKGRIYPFGMTKEGRGTDTQFITSRQIKFGGIGKWQKHTESRGLQTNLPPQKRVNTLFSPFLKSTATGLLLPVNFCKVCSGT